MITFDRESFGRGLSHALALVLVAAIVGLCWLFYDTRRMAIRGSAAADVLERLSIQQAQQAKPPAEAVKP